MLVNKAQTLRGCTRCVARGLSFQERKFQEPGEVAEQRYGGGAPIRAGALALLPIATADPCSWGRKSALPEGAKSSFFVGRLCKTCVLSGYKILGSRYSDQGSRGRGEVSGT